MSETQSPQGSGRVRNSENHPFLKDYRSLRAVVSFAVGFLILGSLSFAIDASYVIKNDPEDLDKGWHFREDLIWAVTFGPVGGCGGFVAGYALQRISDWLRRKKTNGQ
jgi:hypothetical protein